MRSHRLLTLVSVAFVLVLFAPQVLLAQYAISTVAGGGPNNLAALNSSIGYPGSIAFDAAGNTYIADSYSSYIFEVSTAGTLTVVAGNGTRGYTGDGGPATSAALSGPEGVFVDASGDIFIADTENSVIREVVGGTIQTVAGNGKAGYSGDGGPATSAQLNDPYGIFVKAGDIFIADTDNAAIREVVAGTIQTVAGNGTICPDPTTLCGDGGLATSANLDLPQGVFIDASGNIFIADTDDSRIRVVNTGATPITVAGVAIPAGDIATVAGAYYQANGGTACQDTGDNGPATEAYLCAPAGVFVDSSEDIFIADTSNFAIREVAASTGTITTVAGTLGVEGYSPNGTLATSADLNYPSNMVVDASGDIFIADTDNFVIREVAESTGDIQTTIGNNTLAYSGDGAPATNAELNAPGGVAIDSSGNFYIADTASSVIRVVNTGTANITIDGVVVQPGDIQTLAGNGTECSDSTTACGDGGAAISAQLNNPYGVFLDASGNIFIADTGDNRIRVVNTGTTVITVATVQIQPGDIATVAGNGTAGYTGDGGAATNAELAGPNGVFVDSAENIFIADTGNSVIREVTASSGTIATVAGNGTQCTQPATACGDGGAATSAQLSFPAGVFVDLAEDIFIADTFDNRIREVTASNSIINTVAGTGTRGYSGDGAAATSALLDTPYGVFVDSSGNIFIADTDNAAIREVVAATGFIQTVAGIPATATGLPTPGFSGDGGQSTSAELNSPSGLFGDSAGNLFVADTDNSRIRELVPSIFVTVTPNPVNVVVNTPQQFTAAVTGTNNTSVTWYVSGVVGGNSTVGTISTTGLYQAPTTIPNPATVTVTAVSNADNTSSGSAQATIVTAGGLGVKVKVTSNPPVSEVYTGTAQAFIATVTGTSNTAVIWKVNGITGGNATFGTIDTSGNYTGPATVPSPATVTVEAVSEAVSSAVGGASFLVVTVPSAAEPAPQTTSPGGTVTYSLLLNENTGDPKYAISLSCLQSSLPPSATCSFKPPAITPGSQAVPFTLTITVPSGSAFLDEPNLMRLRLYFAFMPLAGILLASSGRRAKRCRWLWLAGLCVFLILLNGCGGGGSNSASTNPELGSYNVKVQGTTSAQPNPVTITIADLTVQ
jgi:hypothetical protein